MNKSLECPHCGNDLNQKDYYEKPVGSDRWWGRCLACKRSSRLTIYDTADGKRLAGSASKVGPSKSQDIKPKTHGLRSDQVQYLNGVKNQSEFVRAALDFYIANLRNIE